MAQWSKEASKRKPNAETEQLLVKQQKLVASLQARLVADQAQYAKTHQRPY